MVCLHLYFISCVTTGVPFWYCLKQRKICCVEDLIPYLGIKVGAGLSTTSALFFLSNYQKYTNQEVKKKIYYSVKVMVPGLETVY